MSDNTPTLEGAMRDWTNSALSPAKYYGMYGEVLNQYRAAFGIPLLDLDAMRKLKPRGENGIHVVIPNVKAPDSLLDPQVVAATMAANALHVAEEVHDIIWANSLKITDRAPDDDPDAPLVIIKIRMRDGSNEYARYHLGSHLYLSVIKEPGCEIIPYPSPDQLSPNLDPDDLPF